LVVSGLGANRQTRARRRSSQPLRLRKIEGRDSPKMASSQIQDVATLADGAPHLSDLSNLEPVDAEFRVHGGDVLCQPQPG